MRAFISLVCLGLLAAACATSTVETRKKERASAYTSLPAEQKTFVDQGKIQVGMSSDAVYLAWGAPAQVLESETPQGHTTIWLYQGQWVQEDRYWIGRRLESDFNARHYVSAEVLFQKGAVVSWRTLPKPVP